MKKRKEKLDLTDKNVSRKLVSGSIIATFIALSPFFFSLYKSVPEQQVWDTFLFTYDSRYWEDAQYAMWVLTQKLIPLLFLLIWFFTCRHWWYHVIIIPIAVYLFQIFDTQNAEARFLEEFPLILILPIMLVIVPSIYLIRAKMFNKLNENKSLQELEDEFTIRPKNMLEKFRDYF